MRPLGMARGVVTGWFERITEAGREICTVFTSRVTRAIALHVLAAIVLIELIILIPSIVDRRSELIESIDRQNRYAAQAITRELPRERWRSALERLPAVEHIALAEGGAGGGTGSNAPSVERPGRFHGPSMDDGSIIAAWHLGVRDDAVVADVRLSAGSLQQSLWLFGLRILGLVFLIAAFVTGVTMAVVGRRVLQPLNQITSAVREARRTGRREYIDPDQPGEFSELVAQYNATIAEQVAAEDRGERLYYQAMHDPLTGLPNRALLGDRLAQAVERYRNYEETAAVLLLDLDRFKMFNDTYGHTVGDELLRAVGERLRSTLVTADTVARLGGDEFAIVQPRVYSVAACERITDAVHRSLAEPFDIDGVRVTETASIGITMLPGDGDDGDTLIVNADLAMYRAKKAGGSCSCRFMPDMRTEMVQRLTLENALIEAIDDEQFELHYQPVVELSDDTVVGYEALIRWHHPEWGLVSPNHFLPVVEESDMIVAVGEWVLRRALMDLPALQRVTPSCQGVAVNVSAGQLGVIDVDALVANALTVTGRAAHELTLEITESAILHSPESTVDGLERASARGTGIAIDDFGTGYSSLAQVQDLPGDVLKIDRRFVTPLTDSRRARDLFAAVVSMGHSLGMKVVAEGIEGPEQLKIVRASGCDRAQGYWFAHPAPLEHLGAVTGFRRACCKPA